MRKWLCITLAVAALVAISVRPAQAQPAKPAGLYGGNCSYVSDGSNGAGLSNYQRDGCAYSPTMLVSGESFPPYTQNAGDFLYINYYLSTDASGNPFPSNIQLDISQGLQKWADFGGNVRFTQIYNVPYNYPNVLVFQPATDGADFQSNCGHAWGQSWYPEMGSITG